MEGHYQAVLWSVAVLAVIVVAAIVIFIVLRVRRSAYYNPVRTEMKKQKKWIRRGEYNAAMVKGRQNLEMLLNLVAERNGIILDNTTQAVNNAKNGQGQSYRWENTGRGRRRVKVMTYQQFGRWLDNRGYLDRVARWELNEIRRIGNRAVHENFSDKDEAVNQYDYLEDLLNIMTEKSLSHQKKSEQPQEKKTTEKPSGNEKEKKDSSQNKPKEEKQDKPGKGPEEKNVKDSNTGQNDNKQKNSNKQSNNNKQSNSNKQNNSSKQNNNKQSNNKQNGGSSEKKSKSDGAEVTKKPETIRESGSEGQEDPAKAVQAVNKKKRSRKRKPKQQPAEKQPERTDEES